MHCHQSLDAISLVEPVTKYAKTALNAHDLPEVLGNAIRAAERGRRGAAFLGLPKDIGLVKSMTANPPLAGDSRLAWDQPYLTSSSKPIGESGS